MINSGPDPLKSPRLPDTSVPDSQPWDTTSTSRWLTRNVAETLKHFPNIHAGPTLPCVLGNSYRSLLDMEQPVSARNHGFYICGEFRYAFPRRTVGTVCELPHFRCYKVKKKLTTETLRKEKIFSSVSLRLRGKKRNLFRDNSLSHNCRSRLDNPVKRRQRVHDHMAIPGGNQTPIHNRDTTKILLRPQ